MGPVVSEKKIFEFFSHSKSMETIDPQGVAKFDPRGMNGTIYVEDHCYIPNIKAVDLVVSEKKIFLVFPIVSLWDLSVAMETTILTQSAPKPNAINPPTQLWFTLNLIKIGLLASEIFFFEIVDGRRRTTTTTDACLSYKLTCEPSAQVS